MKTKILLLYVIVISLVITPVFVYACRSVYTSSNFYRQCDGLCQCSQPISGYRKDGDYSTNLACMIDNSGICYNSGSPPLHKGCNYGYLLGYHACPEYDYYAYGDTNKCPDVSLSGYQCFITGGWYCDWSSVGIWDANEDKCIKCAGKKEDKVFATTSTIYINGGNDAGALDVSNTCEKACGAECEVNSDCASNECDQSTCTCVECICTDWVSGSCGGGSCPSTQRQETRTCPNDCDIESRCVNDASCGSCNDDCAVSGKTYYRCNGDNKESRLCGDCDSDPCNDWCSDWQDLGSCAFTAIDSDGGQLDLNYLNKGTCISGYCSGGNCGTSSKTDFCLGETEVCSGTPNFCEQIYDYDNCFYAYAMGLGCNWDGMSCYSDYECSELPASYCEEIISGYPTGCTLTSGGSETQLTEYYPDGTSCLSTTIDCVDYYGPSSTCYDGACTSICEESCGECIRSSPTSCIGTQTCINADCTTYTQYCNVPEGTSCGTKDCGYLDGCIGTSYREYDDCTKQCSGSTCQDCECTSYTDYPLDPRCTCASDSDCDIKDCDNFDGCYGTTYRDYNDCQETCVEGICQDCACTYIENLCDSSCYSCGDSFCNCGETQSSCCEDCGCPEGYICIDGTCESLCGNDIIDLGENCELPSTFNNDDCDQETSMCDYEERVYCTRDDFGDCDSNCLCTEDEWNCNPADDENYCSNCDDHCGDGFCNCGETDQTCPVDNCLVCAAEPIEVGISIVTSKEDPVILTYEIEPNPGTISVFFDPSIINPPNLNSLMRIIVEPIVTPPGTYEIKVRGASGDTIREATYTLVVP